MQVVGRASLGALEGVLLGFAGRPNLLKVRHDVVTPARRKLVLVLLGILSTVKCLRGIFMEIGEQIDKNTHINTLNAVSLG